MKDAARIGTAEGSAGPLAGVVVLDLTRVVAGPFCAMILADLGATVIKIENPADPDYTRTFPPIVRNGSAEESAFFAQYNRNKEGIAINLRLDEGKALFRRLVREAHVVLENFRPGTMDRLGLSYEVLQAENPAIVYGAISGFGRTGPYSSRPAYDNSGQAAGGLWSMNGYPDQPPVRVGTIIGDVAASLYAAIGVLAALREAEATGRGQVVDISQQDSVLSLTESAVVRYTVDGEVARPLGNDHPFVRPYGQFPCADGFVFFGGYTDKFWALTCEIFGDPEAARDPRIDTMEKRFDPLVAETVVRPLLERWFRRHTKAELEAMVGDKVPLSAIKSIDEVVEDPHVNARGMIVELPVAGTPTRVMGLPIALPGRAAAPHRPAPAMGEHTAAVLARMLGLGADDIAALSRAGVV
ncbi:CaiB/BaiF CoA-transferase family protein [Novosphingobium resinovorum]|uniref:CaiB/BaiF CoA transferase family protein n=1 Tax=Novosphingobium resinovorum TaxID=158500 RepID=UPI002ED15F7B|nr:CaiB/BaiF CoA-transferase family protein [Novosphingobium resinovorum]